MNLILDPTSSNMQMTQTNQLILQAPQEKDILYFNENGFLYNKNLNKLETESIKKSNLKSLNYNYKKQVKFPDDDKIIKDYSEPPERGWIPGKYSTNDLLDAYIRACDKYKSKLLNKLVPQLKALQDLDCSNGEKVNVLNLKNERLDSKQIETLEEVFKRLSFKTIDLESAILEDETSGACLFEILDYYDTCERLILSNVKGLGLFDWQDLSKYIRKTISLEYIDLKGQFFPEQLYFQYLARSFRLTQSLKTIHLENSNINSRLLNTLAAALKENEQIKEVYLGDNKIQPSDGHSIAFIIKENNHLEYIDLKNNNLQDSGLANICSGLSEKSSLDCKGLKSLCLANNSITSSGISYLSKALIHNRSLTNLNISNNSLTNESIYELKDALIVNKKISSLILNKVKISDEGAIALAEYIAESQSIRRIDLRENDIRLGGLMAIASSLKFNRSLDRLDLDREPKREYSIKDSVEQSKRLIQDINEMCLKNKRERELNESIQMKEKEEEMDFVKLNNSNLDESLVQDMNEDFNKSNDSINEDDIDLLVKDDELLKKVLNKTFKLNEEPINEPKDEEYQMITENDINLKPADFDRIIFKTNNNNNNNNNNNHNSNIKESSPLSSSNLNKFKKKLNFDIPNNSDQLNNDVFGLINDLLDKIEQELSINSDFVMTNEDEDSVLVDDNSLNNLNNLNCKIPSLLTPESTPKIVNNLIVENPYFASKLTNSQLSQEISNEIGLV